MAMHLWLGRSGGHRLAQQFESQCIPPAAVAARSESTGQIFASATGIDRLRGGRII
ncbi:MAG: hypothetical protein ACSHYA_00805 [Opitutaceae bacterium]